MSTPSDSAALKPCFGHAGEGYDPNCRHCAGTPAARPTTVDLLAKALQEVRRLHSKRSFSGDGYGWSLCAEDRQQWPCATEQAIRDVLGEPDA